MSTIIFKLCVILFIWFAIAITAGVITFSPTIGLIAFIAVGIIIGLFYKQIFNWVVPDYLKNGYTIGKKVGGKIIKKIYEKYGK